MARVGSNNWRIRSEHCYEVLNYASATRQTTLRFPHEMAPPPAGRKDRTAATIRNVCAIGWTVFLLAAFLLPERWLYQPSLRILDLFLWPIARGLGKPAVVAIVSAALAALTLVVQKFVTDNRRLLEAKRRAANLNKQAKLLAAGFAPAGGAFAIGQPGAMAHAAGGDSAGGNSAGADGDDVLLVCGTGRPGHMECRAGLAGPGGGQGGQHVDRAR